MCKMGKAGLFCSYDMFSADSIASCPFACQKDIIKCSNSLVYLFAWILPWKIAYSIVLL